MPTACQALSKALQADTEVNENPAALSMAGRTPLHKQIYHKVECKYYGISQLYYNTCFENANLFQCH